MSTYRIRTKVKLGFRRVRISFLHWVKSIPELLTWQEASCDECGKCHRVWSWVDLELWKKVVDNESTTLCIDCVLKMAEKRGVTVSASDFKRLMLFSKTTDTKDKDIK